MKKSPAESRASATPKDSDARWLRSSKRPRARQRRQGSIRVVDLFSGCGGITLGLIEAARRFGLGAEVALAVDFDPSASSVYADNFPGANVRTADVSTLFSGAPQDALTPQDRVLAREVGRVDILAAGPPCQGHSDLNNHTRRNDPKNALYFTVARAAKVLRPTVVIIENVPSARRDQSDVVGLTREALQKLGYTVDGAVVNTSLLGLPQARERFLLIASRVEALDPTEFLKEVSTRRRPRRDLRWAIGDLEAVKSEYPIDQPSAQSNDNARRIAYLFDNGVDNLPDSERPPCHRDKKHSYRSVYGRLQWDRPAPTITTGFTSMGQGRYVHPTRRRTITPHEAARLQTFPDWFKWRKAPGRTSLARMIGNAVPPLLMLVVGGMLLSRVSVGEDGIQRDQLKRRLQPKAVLRRGPTPHEGRSPARHQAGSATRDRTRPSRSPVHHTGKAARGSSAKS
jgi:DNA (cytosine-5)-methyltransferase 1